MGNALTKIVTGIKFSSILVKTAAINTWDKKASKRYLIESLGRMPGISAKAAQILSMRLSEQSTDDPIRIEPMPLDLIKSEIENKAPSLASELVEISETPLPASLGQVHYALLRSGEEIAIKVQYPNLKAGFDENMDLLRRAGRMGPPAKFQFEMDAIIDYFEASLLREIDYRIEAEQQTEALRGLPPFKPIVIAQVFPEYSCDTILVQKLEPSVSLGEVAKAWPDSLRQVASRSLLEYFLWSLFSSHFLHTDPHPGNFGFRQVSRGSKSHGQLVELVLYDFGSMMRIDHQHAAVLWQLMEAYRTGEDIIPFDYLVALGFDAKKLIYSAQRLPSLMKKLLEPYARDRAFDFSTWGLQNYFENVLSGDRWWFRSAGPPWLLMMMRSAQGFIHGMAKLGVPLAVQDSCRNLGIQFPPQKIPPVLSQLGQNIKGNAWSMAQKLYVCVTDSQGENIVELELPSESVDEIESYIPTESLAKITQAGIDIPAIKIQVQGSGYVPQELFHIKTDAKTYRVWIK